MSLTAFRCGAPACAGAAQSRRAAVAALGVSYNLRLIWIDVAHGVSARCTGLRGAGAVAPE
jgi:hypothetical protein